jgi:magnesium-transporting ATPase (P-type)
MSCRHREFVFCYILQAVRDGQVRSMHAEFIVPGDVLMVRLGDIVPADIKLLGSDDDEDHAPMQVRPDLSIKKNL